MRYDGLGSCVLRGKNDFKILTCDYESSHFLANIIESQTRGHYLENVRTELAFLSYYCGVLELRLVNSENIID